MGYLSYELNSDERFLAIVRKHFISLALPFSKVGILVAIVLMFSTKFADSQYTGIIVIVSIITSIIYGVYNIVLWYLDCFIITDKRIIDINQRNLFSRVVSEVGARDMEKVIYETKGILATVLDYGTVKIKIANNGGTICMQRIPNPNAVKELITKIQKNPQI